VGGVEYTARNNSGEEIKIWSSRNSGCGERGVNIRVSGGRRGKGSPYPRV